MSVVDPPVAPAPPRFAIPPGVYCVVDERGRQWTNIVGATKLVGRTRRTIQAWMANQWVTVRRTAGGKPEILVSSLWQDEQPAVVGAGELAPEVAHGE